MASMSGSDSLESFDEHRSDRDNLAQSSSTSRWLISCGERQDSGINGHPGPRTEGPTSRERRCKSAADTYARLLLIKRMGYPLWSPEPLNRPLEYEAEGIRIGDVGIIDADGQFGFLFNVCLPQNHPINSRSPPSMVPFTYQSDQLKQKHGFFKPNTVIGSGLRMERLTILQTGHQEPLRFAQFQFSCSAPKAAVLVLPNGVSRTNLHFRREFRDYACQNVLSWYEHVYRTLGLEVKAGPLYLITGYDKCDNWITLCQSLIKGIIKFPVTVPDINPQPHHPSDFISSHLLNTMHGAQIVMIHDDVWCSVIDDNDTAVPDGPELVQRILKKYSPIQETGCVCLDLSAGEESMSETRSDTNRTGVPSSPTPSVTVSDMSRQPRRDSESERNSSKPRTHRRHTTSGGSITSHIVDQDNIGTIYGSAYGGAGNQNVINNTYHIYNVPIRRVSSDGPTLKKFLLRLSRTKSQNDHINAPQPILESPNPQTPLEAQYQSEHPESSITAARSSRPKPIPSQIHPILSGSRRASNASESQESRPGSNIITPQPTTILDENGMAALLRQAVADPIPIVHQTADGIVLAGTLVGLVDLLISDIPDIRNNSRYRDIFLTAYCAYTTTERVYQLLIQKYKDAEMLALESQAMMHYKIVMVMKYWVATPHVLVDMEVLKKMKNFVISIANSGPMTELAHNVAKMIDIRIAENSIPSSLDVDHIPKPKPADITPRDLAIALTVLEGEGYNSLFAADYICHILRPPSNKIGSAINTMNKISTWVIWSILVPDHYASRAGVIKFFINTASECRKLRNFSSIAVIVKALQSDDISRLIVTRDALQRDERRVLQLLSELVGDNLHFRPYKAALSESRDVCVPWIDVHIHDLEAVLRKHPFVVKLNDRPLIDFGRSIEVTNWIQSLLRYKAPRFQQNQWVMRPLAYLQGQLRELDKKSVTGSMLETRSLKFEKEEKNIRETRVREFKSLGLRTS